MPTTPNPPPGGNQNQDSGWDKLFAEFKGRLEALEQARQARAEPQLIQRLADQVKSLGQTVQQQYEKLPTARRQQAAQDLGSIALLAQANAAARRVAPTPAQERTTTFGEAIDLAHKRLSTLERHYETGGEAGSPISQELHKRARQAEIAVARKIADMSPGEQKKAAPEIERLEARRRAVDEEEIERRRRLNNELTRGQYAIAEFASRLAGGDVGGAIGSLAGGAGGIKGVIGAIIVATFKDVIGRRQEYLQELRTGGEALSPAGAQTEQANRLLRQMAAARREGELIRQGGATLLEHRRRQAEDLHLPPDQNPEMWQAHIPFSMYRGARVRAEAQEAGGGMTGWLFGRTPQEETARMRVITQYYENYIRQKGGELTPPPVNMEIPGVRAGVGTSLEYQTQLQLGTLQRRDADTAILQELLRAIKDQGALLEGIRGNTSGLQNTTPATAPQ